MDGINVTNLNKVIIIGNKVLIKPVADRECTLSGLYLPPGVREKEKTATGYVVKVGPGYPIPAITDEGDLWKSKEEVKYVPIQPKPGDLAVYLQSNACEIEFNCEKYLILPDSAILMLVRDEELY